MTTLQGRLSAKREGRMQMNSWNTKDLVRSRKLIAEDLKQKPWIPFFFRTLLTSGTKGPISGLLDVGCGTGFFTRLVARELIPAGKLLGVTGVDISRKSLQAAREEERYSSPAAQRIEYIQADAYHLPFRSSAFGLITSRMVLMHLSSPLRAIREMVRVCRKSGRVVSIEPDWGMFGIYYPNDVRSEMEGEVALRAEIRGRGKLYGQDPSIGRKLPHLLYKAGLRQITIDGMFEVPMVPCDNRTGTSRLKQEYAFQLKRFSDRNHTRELTKLLIAGGLSKRWIQGHLRKSKGRLRRRMKELNSRGSRDRMTGFRAIPFFVAIGRK